MLDQIQLIRMFIRSTGVQPGPLRPSFGQFHSLAAFHLALMAEGVIVVPLYSRQAPLNSPA